MEDNDPSLRCGFALEWRKRLTESESYQGAGRFPPQDDILAIGRFLEEDPHLAWLTLIAAYLCVTTVRWTLIKEARNNRPPLSCPLIYSVYMPPGLSRPRTKPAMAEQPGNYQSISTSRSL